MKSVETTMPNRGRLQSRASPAVFSGRRQGPASPPALPNGALAGPAGGAEAEPGGGLTGGVIQPWNLPDACQPGGQIGGYSQVRSGTQHPATWAPALPRLTAGWLTADGWGLHRMGYSGRADQPATGHKHPPHRDVHMYLLVHPPSGRLDGRWAAGGASSRPQAIVHMASHRLLNLSARLLLLEPHGARHARCSTIIKPLASPGSPTHTRRTLRTPAHVPATSP